MLNERIFDQRGDRKVQGELVKVRTETRKVKNNVENIFGPQCSSRLFRLKFHLLDRSVSYLERFGGFSFTSAGPLSILMFLKRKHKEWSLVGFRRECMRLWQLMSSASDSVHRPGSKTRGVLLMLLS